ncbi:MAG TPA: hypothetical protein VLE49_10595 [Anaerolineales bacterium]|nr:hypothetical protein [Anaerolineales bacterium]
MRYLLILTLLGIAVAGCSAQPGASKPAAKEVPPNNPDIANVAPEGRLTEAIPSETGSPLPAVTVQPPAIVLTPIQGNTPAPAPTKPISPGNWQTFSSAALGVTVNYPADWSVAEETDGATFTSPNGTTIQLKQGTANPNNNEFKIGNQYCTSRTNEHGQTANICVDNASFTYTANFTLQKAGGATQVVTLTTKTRTAGDVFEAMFNSLQPAS